MELSPAVIVGDGRVGHMMKNRGDPGDAMVRSTSELRFQLKEAPGGGPKSGPIYLCVPNSALKELVEACPPERRQDLVFMGSGNLGPFLKQFGLEGNTQALIYFVIDKLGHDPVDGKTSLDPDGLTAVTGKWSSDLAKRLKMVNLSCRIMDSNKFEISRLERLVWTCATHLVAKANKFTKVGQVVESHWSEVEEVMHELVRVLNEQAVSGSVQLEASQFYERMKEYTLSIGHFNTVVKDLEFRNGYFYKISQERLAKGLPDPCPMHTKLLKKVKAVK